MILIDLPNTDILDYRTFKNKLKNRNIEAIIHLAWNCKVENFSSDQSDPNNLIIYGISDNDKAIHNLKNTINWIPKIKATDFLQRQQLTT